MKYLIIMAVIYYIYKRYIALPPGPPPNTGGDSQTPTSTRNQTGEYIDYEEVD